MNLVGKIFVVLILIMSVVFMSLAMAVYATHRNWRDYVEASPGGLRPQLQQLQAEQQELQETKRRLETTLEAEKAAYQQQLAKLESETQQLSEQRAQMQQELQDLSQKSSVQATAVESTAQNAAALMAQVVALREDIKTAQQQRDQMFDQLIANSEQLHQEQGDLVRASEQLGQLTRDVGRYRQLLEENNIDPMASPDGLPPSVYGEVRDVRDGRLEVSIGSDDGLRVGHTVEVWRDQTYLGRAEIVRTAPDRAVAEMIKSYQRGVVQVGDRVATKLKVS
jgi:chemotaxis protein histidine kinase CheA